MFRKMRRKAQQIPDEESIAILEGGKTGILGVIGDDGYPYTVPVNFAYEDGKIHFHGAMTGHKIESIRKNNKVSFTVIDQDEVVERDRTTAYKSVICFGRAEEVTDHDEKVHSLRLVGYKYSGAFPDLVEEEIREAADHTCCVRITIEHMTGKEGKVLLEKRRQK